MKKGSIVRMGVEIVLAKLGRNVITQVVFGFSACTARSLDARLTNPESVTTTFSGVVSLNGKDTYKDTPRRTCLKFVRL